MRDLTLQHQIQNAIILQQDRAPPHNAEVVTKFLNERYPRMKNRSAGIAWPARYHPLRFLFIVKEEVYMTPLVNMKDQDLKNRIRDNKVVSPL